MTEKPSMGCARCGNCCDPIWIDRGFDPNDPRYDPEPGSTMDLNLSFIKEHWTKTGGGDKDHEHWQCDQFDAEQRTCNAHESRPPVCQGFPWYGRPPSREQGMSLECSYIWDLPRDQWPVGARPLIPVEVVTRPKGVC